MALGSTRPITEMSTRSLPGGKGRPARGWQPHRHLWADCLENVGELEIADGFHTRPPPSTPIFNPGLNISIN
jgi:hypothetical protein